MNEIIKTPENNQDIMAFFGLGKVFESTSAGGYSNDNHFIKTDKGEYFLKIIKERTNENEIITEFKFVERIQEGGIKLLPYIKNDNGEVLYKDGSTFAVVQERVFIEPARKITPEIITQIGAQLGQLHMLQSKGLSDRIHWLHSDWLKKAKIFAQRTIGTKGISILLEEEKLLPDWSTFPQVIIHGDIHRGNLLVEDQELVAIIDWEEVGIGAAVLDFAMTVGGTCYRYDYGFQEDIFLALYTAYTKVRPFNKKERDAIPQALRSVCINMDLWEHRKRYIKDGVGLEWNNVGSQYSTWLRYGAKDWELPEVLRKY